MSNYLFRPSSIGRMMTEPKSKSEGPLSVGAKTYIRELAAQELFGVQFEVSSKYMDKGVQCEQDSIDLLNQVRGMALLKNTERRVDDYLTGECDLFDVENKRGHDLKTSWSLATFPISEEGCIDKLYEWQMRAYMRLWDADEWEVNYAMVSTPEDLMRYEPMPLHVVDHIPPEHRITSWVITRDMDKEAAMIEKIKAARVYFDEVVREFDRTHRMDEVVAYCKDDVTEEVARLEREAAAKSSAEAIAKAEKQALDEIVVANDSVQDGIKEARQDGAMPSMLLDELSNAANLLMADSVAEHAIATAQRKAATPPTMSLGEISTKLGFNVTSVFLASLGFEAVTVKAAKLFQHEDFPLICAAIVQHINDVCMAD